VLPRGRQRPILGVRPDAVYTTGLTRFCAGRKLYVFTEVSPRRPIRQGELFAEARREAVLRRRFAVASTRVPISSTSFSRKRVPLFFGNALPSDFSTIGFAFAFS